ncbi:MAG: NACHT domain-containing protein [Burkholderiaceae bacterium]
MHDKSEPKRKSASAPKTRKAVTADDLSPAITRSAEATVKLSEEELPNAIGKLFELNNYTVAYSKEVNGAEIDLVATPKGAAFGAVVYIEATVQYVDTAKFGKDATKFILVKRKDPSAICLSVSTSGFTPDVLERGTESGIELRTYQALFRQFEKFAPYVDEVLNRPNMRALVDSYEEPHFRDKSGEEHAVKWLNGWKADNSGRHDWLIILGEYGTGKTALTMKLQHDWLTEYRRDPSHPIPIRIELKNFTRQFDARSLLHHFLDANQLGYIPIDFLFHLIRSRRVILILDGYDEMAQFLNARERRACLAALADLANEGAKGILTSRPNYFTETEELRVFEALYSSIERKQIQVGAVDRAFVAEEKSIDELLNRYLLNKYERYLRDLTLEQTTSLVRRKLGGDPAGQDLVLKLLTHVFREEGGHRYSLGGKPVIVTYLMELIDELRGEGSKFDTDDLTEWQIYRLIVDRLMMRDLQRSPGMPQDVRRVALQKLAVTLSNKDSTIATEQVFMSVIEDAFRGELRRLSGEERRSRLDELFQDLRSSTTLTRSEGQGSGWVFSHNSLREFLVAEAAVTNLIKGRNPDSGISATSTMRTFVAALSKGMAAQFLGALRTAWREQRSESGLYVGLGFDLFKTSATGLRTSLGDILGRVGAGLDFQNSSIKGVVLDGHDLGDGKLPICARGATLAEVTFRGIDLSGSDFDGATFDECKFIDCDLSSSNFQRAFAFECNFDSCAIGGADFSKLELDSTFIFRRGDAFTPVAGKSALGLLRYLGASTDEISYYYEFLHDPRYSIVRKISERLIEQRNNQMLGLTQRGASANDPPFARSFMDFLKNANLIEVKNELASTTAEGRKVLIAFLENEEIFGEMEHFLKRG